MDWLHIQLLQLIQLVELRPSYKFKTSCIHMITWDTFPLFREFWGPQKEGHGYHDPPS